MKVDRLFVPLATTPFKWFKSGDKLWELRNCKRNFTEKHVYVGRRVELRKGYSGESVWGTIEKVVIDKNIGAFFLEVFYKDVIPPAISVFEACDFAEHILKNNGSIPVIGFKIQLDNHYKCKI